MPEPTPLMTAPAADPDDVLASVVEALRAQSGSLATPLRHNSHHQPLPSRAAIVEACELLRTAIFPGYYGASHVTEESLPFHLGATLDQAAQLLEEQVRRGLCFVCALERCDCNLARCGAEATRLTAVFLQRLPEVRRLLALDAVAAWEGDPAATSPSEAIFCYPGLFALTSHRVAHELQRIGVPLIPRIIAEHAHSLTGIDIHPGASIGERFFVDHGTGVVIGETCRIGARVRLYQGVTLGAKSFPLDEHGRPIKGTERHPIVEDDVTIYSGATILGRVTIGRGSIIGGNVWLTRSVPPGSRIVQARPAPEPLLDGAGI